MQDRATDAKVTENVGKGDHRDAAAPVRRGIECEFRQSSKKTRSSYAKALLNFPLNHFHPTQM